MQVNNGPSPDELTAYTNALGEVAKGAAKLAETVNLGRLLSCASCVIAREGATAEGQPTTAVTIHFAKLEDAARFHTVACALLRPEAE